MTDTNFIRPADRIADFKPYFFAQLNKTITALRAEGKEIIRLDMGSPDLAPPDFIIDALNKAAANPALHNYAPLNGTASYKKAGAAYYQKRFGVDVDPETEILSLIGSKEGLFHLEQSILNPGDTIIIPNPGYPVYRAAARIAGANIYDLPLHPENSYLPDFQDIPEEVARKAKILWLNYPNNPTGAVADLQILKQAVDFCMKYQILLAHDAPYCDITFDGFQAPSILQIPGAKQVSVEFNSLSKTYNMAGWRLGFMVGNPEVVRIVHTYKSQVDTSTFIPLMAAAEQALTGDQTWLQGRNEIYRQRRDIVIQALREMGIEAEVPRAAFYIWTRFPVRFPDSVTFCDRLLREAGVSTTPGSNFGSMGEGYFRISLGQDTMLIQKAMHNMKNWLSRV
ncbi:MAG: aminotransferase class I/II-fold pyridoxal phosphate-dependent enzyme [Anaerolineaceae bacterium]|nr:aminotransferase class I/II-fold pyridoxal phosphate-dependent enzyme [Anaerolineaceae bacterium]